MYKKMCILLLVLVFCIAMPITAWASEVTVSIDLGGGMWANVSDSSFTVSEGATWSDILATLKSMGSQDPIWDGYTFKNWSTQSGSTLSANDTAAVNDNVTVYAVWENRNISGDPELVTSTINLNGGNISGNTGPIRIEDFNTNITWGDVFEKLDDLGTPEMNGFEFTGWTYDGNDINGFDSNDLLFSASSTSKTASIQLVAGWTQTAGLATIGEGDVPLAGSLPNPNTGRGASTSFMFVIAAACEMAALLVMEKRTRKENV